jgi:hypothetical protein
MFKQGLYDLEVVAESCIEPLSADGAPHRSRPPAEQVPFGSEGARFLCNLLQHGVFLGVVVLMLMVIGYFGAP